MCCCSAAFGCGVALQKDSATVSVHLGSGAWSHDYPLWRPGGTGCQLM